MDPHSFFADPDPAVFLNADLDPAAFLLRIRIWIQIKQICKTNYHAKSLLELKKTQNIVQT